MGRKLFKIIHMWGPALKVGYRYIVCAIYPFSAAVTESRREGRVYTKDMMLRSLQL